MNSTQGMSGSMTNKGWGVGGVGPYINIRRGGCIHVPAGYVLTTAGYIVPGGPILTVGEDQFCDTDPGFRNIAKDFDGYGEGIWPTGGGIDGGGLGA